MTSELRAFLYGHPVSHSVSPAMHNAAFRQLGIAARYEARDVAPEDLERALAELRGDGILGANLTVPHKEAALRHLDEVSEAAAVVGAVNTVRNENGRLVGFNTDTVGFLAGLAEAGFEVRGKRAAVLGAGGAARAVASALVEAGVAELFVLNRTRVRAVALVQDLVGSLGAGAYWGLPLDSDWSREVVPECDLVVNTTTVGLHDDRSPLAASALRPTMLVVDIIYNPPRTRLLRDAEAAGARTQNGLPMLVHQAAAAFRVWTGREAPIETLRSAAETALSQAGVNGRVLAGPGEG